MARMGPRAGTNASASTATTTTVDLVHLVEGGSSAEGAWVLVDTSGMAHTSHTSHTSHADADMAAGAGAAAAAIPDAYGESVPAERVLLMGVVVGRQPGPAWAWATGRFFRPILPAATAATAAAVGAGASAGVGMGLGRLYAPRGMRLTCLSVLPTPAPTPHPTLSLIDRCVARDAVRGGGVA